MIVALRFLETAHTQTLQPFSRLLAARAQNEHKTTGSRILHD